MPVSNDKKSPKIYGCIYFFEYNRMWDTTEKLQMDIESNILYIIVERFSKKFFQFLCLPNYKFVFDEICKC